MKIKIIIGFCVLALIAVANFVPHGGVFVVLAPVALALWFSRDMIRQWFRDH